MNDNYTVEIPLPKPDDEKDIEKFVKKLESESTQHSKIENSKIFLEMGRNMAIYSLKLAIKLFEVSLKAFTDSNDALGKAKCLYYIGECYSKLSNFANGITYIDRALEIAIAKGNSELQGKCYIKKGILYSDFGAFHQSIRFYELALPIAISKSKRMEASCLLNIGTEFGYLYDFTNCFTYTNKAIAKYEEINDQYGKEYGKEQCYLTLSLAHLNNHDISQAMIFCKDALALANKLNDMEGKANALLNMGLIYNKLNDQSEAIILYEQALQIAERIRNGNANLQIKCHMSIGTAYDAIGSSKAIKSYQEAYNLAKKINNNYLAAQALANIGNAFFTNGNLIDTISNYKKALRRSKKSEDYHTEGICILNLGYFHLTQNNRRRSLYYYRKGLRVAKKKSYIDLEVAASAGMGRIYFSSNPSLAYKYLINAIKLTEQFTKRMFIEKHKIRYYDEQNDLYRRIVPLCIKLHKEKEAFTYAEKSKSRALVEMMASRTQVKPSENMTRELKSLIERLEECLKKLEENREQVESPIASSTLSGSEINRLITEMNKIYDKIEKIDPKYVYLRRGNPTDIEKIQNFLEQKAKSIMIEYFLSADGVIIFILSSKMFHVTQVKLSANKLNQFIKSFQKEVKEYSTYGNRGNSWTELGVYLIKPISHLLVNVERIYFIPHGLLHYIPLHALNLNEEPIIKKFSVVYFQSATITQFQNQENSLLRTASVFGVEDFNDEAKEVANILKCKPYIDAAKDEVLRNIDEDIAHFSCHGKFDDDDPLSSGVKLYSGISADDESSMLQAREIFNLRLKKTKIVTLSACETGINYISPGDELLGLTRSFVYAGARSVIVSLWSVNYLSTSKMMAVFYKHLMNGKDTANSLRLAQLNILNDKKYSHEYYWSAFVQVGE